MECSCVETNWMTLSKVNVCIQNRGGLGLDWFRKVVLDCGSLFTLTNSRHTDPPHTADV